MATELPHLTSRELQVLRLIAGGRTNGEIAEELGISFSTAKWHVSEMLSKAGVESREELAAFWQAERSPSRRFARIFSTMLPFAPVKTAAFVGIAGVATASAVFVASAAVSSADLNPGGDVPAVQAPTTSPPSGFMELFPSPPGSTPIAGGTPASMSPGATATPASRILGVFPGSSPLDPASLTVVYRYMPLGDFGVCAEVSTAGLSANFQWFRLHLDGVDVTQSLTIIATRDVPRGILCHIQDIPLASGTHAASVTVSDPTTGVFIEQKDWTFEIP